MKFKAHINIMPKKELLDPQGKTVTKNMAGVNVTGVHDVRIGKRIEMTLEANDEASAKTKVDTACEGLLANLIMESYEYELETLA